MENPAPAGDLENPLEIKQRRVPIPNSQQKNCFLLSVLFVILVALAIALGIAFTKGDDGPGSNVIEKNSYVNVTEESTTTTSTATTETTTTTTSTKASPYTGSPTTTAPKSIFLETDEGTVQSEPYSSCDDLKLELSTALRDIGNSIIAEEKSNDWFAKCDPKDTELHYPWWYTLPTTPVDTVSYASTSGKMKRDADIVKTHGDLTFAAYSDVLFAWNSSQHAAGLSVTRMQPGCVTDTGKRGRNLRRYPFHEVSKRHRKTFRAEAVQEHVSKEECTPPTTRPVKLLVHGDRLVLILSEETANPSDISNHSSTLIKLYNISSVPSDSNPLQLLASSKIQGTFEDARKVDSIGIIASKFSINTWFFIEDLFRYKPQYCGLSASEYQELASNIALNDAEIFVQEMVEELQLDDDCDRIYHVVNKDFFGNTGEIHKTSNHLGVFVEVSAFNISSDFKQGETQFRYASAFSETSHLNSTVDSLIDILFM